MLSGNKLLISVLISGLLTGLFVGYFIKAILKNLVEVHRLVVAGSHVFMNCRLWISVGGSAVCGATVHWQWDEICACMCVFVFICVCVGRYVKIQFDLEGIPVNTSDQITSYWDTILSVTLSSAMYVLYVILYSIILWFDIVCVLLN